MRYGTLVLRTWHQHAFLVAFGACGALLGAAGCKGSEHVVLAPIWRSTDNPSGGSSGAAAGGSGPADGGNSQPIDAGDRDADDGPPEVDSGLDPTVEFDWEETLPGLGKCGPGQYVGAFSCTLEIRPAGPPLVGQMILTVTASSESESKLIVTGRLADPTGLFYGADVAGTLDCSTNELKASTPDVVIDPMGMEPSIFEPAGFLADVSGTYDPQTLDILGSLEIVNDAQEVWTGSFQIGSAL